MRLYYSPGACSLSPHIVLRESGIKFALDRVDLGTKRTETGADFNAISPNGYVPALDIGEDPALTEGPAIIQFIADQNPESKLAPKAGTIARARLQSHLNFISTEIHKSFSPLFTAGVTDEAKAAAREKVSKRLKHIEHILSDKRAYLMGDDFTVADAYLFTVTRWTRPTSIAIDDMPYLTAFMTRVSNRSAVKAALEAEGLN
jgi:glutathione S-transferase